MDAIEPMISKSSSLRGASVTTRVQLYSDDTDGTVRTIIIEKTGVDAAHIDVESSAVPGSTQSHNLKNVKADAPTLTMSCKVDAFFSADISVAVQSGTAGRPPVATIIVSHAIFGNGTYLYPLRAGEDARMKAFLRQAAFPPLSAAGA